MSDQQTYLDIVGGVTWPNTSYNYIPPNAFDNERQSVTITFVDGVTDLTNAFNSASILEWGIAIPSTVTDIPGAWQSNGMANWTTDLANTVNITDATNAWNNNALTAESVDFIIEGAIAADWAANTTLGIDGGTNSPPREDVSFNYTNRQQAGGWDFNNNLNPAVGDITLVASNGTFAYSDSIVYEGSHSLDVSAGAVKAALPADFNFSDSFYLDCRVYRTGASGSLVMRFFGAGEYHYSIDVVNGYVRVLLSALGGTTFTGALSTSDPLPLNQWARVQVLYQNSKIWAAVDGVVVTGLNGLSVTPSIYQGTTAFMEIGGRNDTPTSFFPGYIDNLRIEGTIGSRTLVANIPERTYKAFEAGYIKNISNPNAELLADLRKPTYVQDTVGTGAVLATKNGRQALKFSNNIYTTAGAQVLDELTAIAVFTTPSSYSGNEYIFGGLSGGRFYLYTTAAGNITVRLGPTVGDEYGPSTIQSSAPTDTTFIVGMRISNGVGSTQINGVSTASDELVGSATVSTFCFGALGNLSGFNQGWIHAIYLHDSRDITLAEAMGAANLTWSVY